LVIESSAAEEWAVAALAIAEVSTGGQAVNYMFIRIELVLRERILTKTEIDTDVVLNQNIMLFPRS
jgi:hypothetical protein